MTPIFIANNLLVVWPFATAFDEWAEWLVANEVDELVVSLVATIDGALVLWLVANVVDALVVWLVTTVDGTWVVMVSEHRGISQYS